MSQDPDTKSEGSDSSHSPQPDRKRKRAPDLDDELEIDLNLPEPPSKKALRKLKKAKPDVTKPAETAARSSAAAEVLENDTEKESAPAKSEWGVWIGNMLWTTSKDDLRGFLAEKGGIAQAAITRVHMPPPPQKGPTWKGPKPINKGFAYVDFATEADMLAAIGLSEALLAGRKVLIKNAKSFEGRPDTKANEAAATLEKAPSKRIFVGNLTFDTTTEDVREHFAQAGVVEDVFLTTFEDSGKCKGYGWVRFSELEAAQAAVAGYIYKTQAADNSDEDEGAAKDSSKKQKARKWFINRLQGRALRCEFAEDAQSRYKKRYGKGTKQTEEKSETDGQSQIKRLPHKPAKRLDKDERQALRRQKHEDARLIAPGQALARAQRASAAIVTPAGKKTSFN